MTPEPARDVLMRFAERVVPSFKRWPHTERIFSAIAPAIRGKALRTWLCVPPRFGKTESALVLAAFLVTTFPVTVGYATYSDELAIEASDRLQAMVALAGHTRVRGRSRADSWRVAGGGKFLCGGYNSGWAGKGVDLLLVDDLLKGDEQARSGLIRDKVWRSLIRDLDSRRDRKDASAIIGIGTRWHADDPGGRIIAGRFGEPFDIVTLPARAPDGTLLCAELLSAKQLDRLKTADPAGYWSLYMQDPRPDGVAIFALTPAPSFERSDWKRDGHRVAIFCDPAATAKTSSDRSAIGVCAMKGFGDAATLDVVEAIHGRFDPAQLAGQIVELWKRWGKALEVHVEAIGTGAFLPTLIRQMSPEISRFVKPIASTPLIKLTSDKYARAQPVARAFNLGRVRFANASWTGGALDELYAFTGLDDPHDDFVDMLAHGWNTLYRGAVATTRGVRAVNNLPYG